MDLLQVPTYTPAMVGRMIGLKPDRVRRWLHGYRYTYYVDSFGDKLKREKRPVVRSTRGDDERYASFLELIDLLFVKQFIKHGMSLQKLRKALDEAETILGERHFSKKKFFTDGTEIFLALKKKSNDGTDNLMRLLSGGQWAIPEIIKQTASRIDFDSLTEYATRWYPLSDSNLVVIDPKISFGAPTLLKRGIKTVNIYDLYIAEGKSVDAVSDWMEIERIEVESAIEFEMKLAA
jgi:uncharacterized protein (DUF433 family)